MTRAEPRSSLREAPARRRGPRGRRCLRAVWRFTLSAYGAQLSARWIGRRFSSLGSSRRSLQTSSAEARPRRSAGFGPAMQWRHHACRPCLSGGDALTATAARSGASRAGRQSRVEAAATQQRGSRPGTPEPSARRCVQPEVERISSDPTTAVSSINQPRSVGLKAPAAGAEESPARCCPEQSPSSFRQLPAKPLPQTFVAQLWNNSPRVLGFNLRQRGSIR
jgi:hypothetical protein